MYAALGGTGTRVEKTSVILATTDLSQNMKYRTEAHINQNDQHVISNFPNLGLGLPFRWRRMAARGIGEAVARL